MKLTTIQGEGHETHCYISGGHETHCYIGGHETHCFIRGGGDLKLTAI